MEPTSVSSHGHDESSFGNQEIESYRDEQSESHESE
ncbi:hypothetical protein ACP70R_028323 [Stipagrostis hirtigluma subsp. patula]